MFPKETKIAIIEDSYSMLTMLSKCLQSLGLKNIIEFQSGEEAKSFLENGDGVDLIISDLHMPDINGLELLQVVRDSEKLKNLPFIIMSSDAQKVTIIEVLKSGASQFLSKPFTEETIKEKLLRAWEKLHE